MLISSPIQSPPIKMVWHILLSAATFMKFLFFFLIIICSICVRTSNSQDDSTTPFDPTLITKTTATTTTSSLMNDRIDSFRSSQALQLLKSWASRFGRDVHYGTQEATCIRSIREQFNPARRTEYKTSVASIDWTQMHTEIVKTISNTMEWHKKAVESIAKASEDLAEKHMFNNSLTYRYEYIDVHRLHSLEDERALYNNNNNINNNDQQQENNQSTNNNNNLSIIGEEGGGGGEDAGLRSQSSDHSSSINWDERGSQGGGGGESPGGGEPEQLPKPSMLQSAAQQQQQQQQQSEGAGAGSQTEWETPIRYLNLAKHKHFGDVPIDTEESAVHVPVHIFPGDTAVMNGIAWSDGLTKVFKDNFVRNPKLTNQYFASQSGFLRLYPAQPWQIPKAQPDLYDGRMRPWYVAGASSRKDVIILVDSSGSMTGSRRDIAKGVVFEILDTLTDNDHFLILRFADFIQQVGVPSCSGMRVERKPPSIPQKNTWQQYQAQNFADNQDFDGNKTDMGSLYLLPATGRNVRHIKTNFTISTSGIANFSNALITAFEVLGNYQRQGLGADCNQAIMLITDGSPSDFEDIFNRYNYPNAPVRVFTYLIGREAGDVAHTKMMACHNRGYYTHVINLAEVRETVQQYIPVMARPLVLNGTHPITWTPAYGELTYQILTDWIWESKRRDKARAILAANKRGSASNAEYVPNIRISNSDGMSYSDEDYNGGGGGSANEGNEYETMDLFGYNANIDCFWETRRNDLLTTVVQPVYDRKNESVVTEKFLVKNVWTVKETVMRTAQILGVAAADMKINDIIALAPSHKLGPNGYAVMLTNNGYAMHHPDLRSILEPFSSDPSEKEMRILKPFFSSLDFTQVEHILVPSADKNIVSLRNEAVLGLTGWRELPTKRTADCQKRVQTRRQNFYYKQVENFPFSFMIAIPQPYGSHKVEAQVKLKSLTLPEKLTTYFTTSDYDLWTVHPDYQYCHGPSNNTVTTLLDMCQRIESGKLEEVEWLPAESISPPVFFPGKIFCDKDLVQSLVFDAVATFMFSDSCGPPSPNAESSLLGMFGVRFSFVATRSGLTRVRHYGSDDDMTLKYEALSFAHKHARAVDETYYSRTVDYNMLVNDSATLVQVPFNTFEKIRDRLNRYEMNQVYNLDASSDQTIESLPSENRLSVKDMSLIEKLDVLTNTSIHVIATESIIVKEGTQRAVAGVTGVFYDYASFVLRFFNSTNNRFEEGRPMTKPASCYADSSSMDPACDDSKIIKCGLSNDTIDCLLIDNNGYIVVSEELDLIGKHLKAYDPIIMSKLTEFGVFQEINITDYQSVCLRQEEKQTTSSAISSFLFRFSNSIKTPSLSAIANNLLFVVSHTWTTLIASISMLSDYALAVQQTTTANFGVNPARQQQAALRSMQSLLPNKTYLRPCEKILTLYERRPGVHGSEKAEHYTTKCGCNSWFVYEEVPMTNLFLLIVDSTSSCRQGCDPTAAFIDPTDPLDAVLVNRTIEDQVCSVFEREAQFKRKKPDLCFSQHSEEEHIKLCGSGSSIAPIREFIIVLTTFMTILLSYRHLYQLLDIEM